MHKSSACGAPMLKDRLLGNESSAFQFKNQSKTHNRSAKTLKKYNINKNKQAKAQTTHQLTRNISTYLLPQSSPAFSSSITQNHCPSHCIAFNPPIQFSSTSLQLSSVLSKTQKFQSKITFNKQKRAFHIISTQFKLKTHKKWSLDHNHINSTAIPTLHQPSSVFFPFNSLSKAPSTAFKSTPPAHDSLSMSSSQQIKISPVDADQTFLNDPILTTHVEAHITKLFQNIISHNQDHISKLITHYQQKHSQKFQHSHLSSDSSQFQDPLSFTPDDFNILSSTIKTHADNYIFDFATFYSHIYPIQHKPINSDTPIVVLSTVSFQHYLQQTFDLISQYKAFLQDPRAHPLPSSIHSYLPTTLSSPPTQLHQIIQSGTARSLAVATFMDYPVVTLENLGLSVEALAYACGFSHEHIPIPYKCLGSVLKHKFLDKEGKEIRLVLKKGLSSKLTGTKGKATKQDLERWGSEVHEHSIEFDRQKHLKQTQIYRDEMLQAKQAKFSGKMPSSGIKNYNFGESGHADGDNGEENDFHQYNEVDPLETEARLSQQIEDLENKSFEKLIHSMISQRLYTLGVKAVVVVDDVVDSHNDNFYLHLQEYMNNALSTVNNSVEQELNTGYTSNSSPVSKENHIIDDPYAFSGDFKQNPDEQTNTISHHNNSINKFTKTQLHLAIKVLYQHYLTIFAPDVHEKQQNNTTMVQLTTSKNEFNPQFVQSFFEWVMGFGMNPAQFHQHTQYITPFLTDVLKSADIQNKASSSLLETTQLIQNTSVPTQIHQDLTKYVQTTVDLVKGLHVGDIDATLYHDVLSNSKSGGIYSLLLKSNTLSKKQNRKRRHDTHLQNAHRTQTHNRLRQKKQLGGDDNEGWNNDVDTDVDSDLDHNASSNNESDGDAPNEEYDDSQIDELTKYLTKPLEAPLVADEIILHRDSDHRNSNIRTHIDENLAKSIRDSILAKENVIFGPLVGVDFVNGIARTKRLRGSFDQKSPLIQAVLGSRNAVKATPNSRNPLLSVTESYAKKKYEDEQKEVLLNLQQEQLDQQQQLLAANGPRKERQSGTLYLNNPFESNKNLGNDKLLPFWEQLDFEQNQMEQDMSSIFSQNNSSDGTGLMSNMHTGALSTHASHLLSHYETTDKNTPMGEIIPLQTLQQQDYLKQEERRVSQLRHLTQQQQIKKQRQDEWLQVVNKHVASGNANIVEDSIDPIFHGDQEQLKKISTQLLLQPINQSGEEVIIPVNSSTQIQSSHSNFTKFLTIAPSPIESNSIVPKSVNPQTIPLQYTTLSQTITTLTHQQRVYSEASAYIVRHYAHHTSTTTSPQLELLSHIPTEFFNAIPEENTKPTSCVETTTSTVVSRLLRICDVTGGFGTDSFILASSINTGKDMELEVSMVEGDKILFTLLCDGIRRGQQVHQYRDLKLPKILPINRKSRKSDHLSGHRGHSGSSIGGFGYDNIYSDDDIDNANHDNHGNELNTNGDSIEDQSDPLDDTSYENTPEQVEETIHSLKRERYFPHSKVTLPKIHGLDLNDPSVQKKLNKKGKFGSSASDLHFESVLKQQQRIVELAEKSLKNYIEGGLGDDQSADPATKGQTNMSTGAVNMTITSSANSVTPQSAHSSNPLLRNKVLSLQHLQEVSLITKRMKVVYGNSLEYLTRTHFRVPASLYESSSTQVDTTVQLYTNYKKQFDTTSIFDAISSEINSKLNLTLPPLSPMIPKLINLSIVEKSPSKFQLATVVKDIDAFDANPHISPVFSSHYPYPTHTPSTSFQIHRPYDVIYMDPFYPVKNRGKRAKYKMLQRNSKFMSFAKQLQDIYLLQEPRHMKSRFKTNLLLSKLVEFSLNKNQASQSLPSTSLLTRSKNNILINGVDAQSDNLIGDFTYQDINDVMNHLDEISAKLALYQSVSNDINKSSDEHVNDELLIDPEQSKPKISYNSFKYYTKEISSSPLPLLSTSAQYELYSSFMNIIYSVYSATAIEESSSGLDAKRSANKSSSILSLTNSLSSAKKLTQIYSILYTMYPAALPLYLNALSSTTHSFISPLTKTPNTTDPNSTSIGSSHHPLLSTAPSKPFTTISSSKSLILTREPENTHLMFDAARITANRRVVVKRPIYAPIIHKEQTVCVEDNKTRFDVVNPLASHSFTNRVLHSILNRVRSRYNAQYQYNPLDFMSVDGVEDVSAESLTQQQFLMLYGNGSSDKPISTPGLATNASQFESVLCYDNASQHGVYNSKLAKKNNLTEALTQSHLRSPIQPYLAFTNFSNLSSADNVEALKHSHFHTDNDSTSQLLNHRKIIKAQKQKEDDKTRNLLRKAKRKGKRK